MKTQAPAGDVAGTEHRLQLFDNASSRAAAVAAFVRDGLAAGDSLLLVVAPEHWKRAAPRLTGVDVDAAMADRRLTVCDAAATLSAFMHRGVPDPERFEASVGALVRQLSSRGRRLLVYGEMVDVLATRGDFDAAGELEALWNQLAARHRFTLLCGYSAVSFGDPRSARALRDLCSAHSHVLSSPGDVLGAFLLGTYR